MKKTLLTLSVLMLPLLALPATAEARNWVRLGERVIGHQVDKETFHLSHSGSFKAISFRVYNNDLRILRFQVKFANGERVDVNVGRVVPAGGTSGYIDLPGHRRVIKKVQMWVKTVGRRGPPARVVLFGKIR
jgi:hypothetical protein